MNSPEIKWAVKILSDLGYHIENTAPEKILETAWSQVCRFITNQGVIYLKKVPPGLSLEASVIKLLHEQFHAHVPLVIAKNKEHHCFLMHDAGIPLHDFFKQGFEANVLLKTLDHYTALQLASVDKIALFLKLGVPDWRLEKLPMLYQQLIAEEKLLIEDGLTHQELKTLQGLDTKLIAICEQLAQYNIPDAFGHADFHDKNILVNLRSHQTTLIDLGEVVITHPFFSFHNCLYRATENHGLSDVQYKQLQEACFRNWLSLETRKHLFEIIAIIQRCWSIHAVLGEFRLIKSVDPLSSELLQRQGRFAGKLRIWIHS